MARINWVIAGLVMVGVVGLEGYVFGEEKPLPPVPPAYATKHMPAGWWTDQKIKAEGKKIFEEKTQTVKSREKGEEEVQCAKCHGKDGKPEKRGVKDMRSAKLFNRFSDSYWFWRMSEGVPKTRMPSWKNVLTEEERWKVMAYEHTYSHGGKSEPHEHPEIQKTTGP